MRKATMKITIASRCPPVTAATNRMMADATSGPSVGMNSRLAARAARRIPNGIASTELKTLYREVAKRVHPDLATDEADRHKREQLMAEANAAYQRGDADALRRILEEYEGSPESVRGAGIAAD